VTPDGIKWFEDFGIPIEGIKKSRRHFARQCLDWSERRHHMAGMLGAAVTGRLFELKWIERIPNGRAIRVTDDGLQGFAGSLALSLELPQ